MPGDTGSSSSQTKPPTDRDESSDRSLSQESQPAPSPSPSTEAASEDTPSVPFARISDDGILLAFAAAACLLAATTAYIRGQPAGVYGFAFLGGATAGVGTMADFLTDFTPGTTLEVCIGALGLLAAAAAVSGPHYVNLATLLAASALIFWRVYDVEYRGAAR